MKWLAKSLHGVRSLAVIALLAAFFVGGCGTPGAPQPPSLKLPGLVTDLTAARSGDVVTLHWTMPLKTTDHLLLSKTHGPVPVSICWRIPGTEACHPAGEAAFAPGAEGTFQETLTGDLANAPPRQLIYFVELKNKTGKSGRSAGYSNSAVVAAGSAPGPITGLVAETRADGVALHWDRAEKDSMTAVRLHRTLLNPVPARAGGSQSKAGKASGSSGSLSGGSDSQTEPVLRDFLVDSASAANVISGSLDSTAKFGAVYEYTAQRVNKITVDGKAFELAGPVSAPAKVSVIDVFPPAIPLGLAAVAVPEEHSIDLSWQPDTEEDLAGYIVYRKTDDSADWKKISGAQPLNVPAYRDLSVEPGHTYHFRISAIDQTGHESQPSSEAEETMPKPDGI